MHDSATFDDGVDKLIAQIKRVAPGATASIKASRGLGGSGSNSHGGKRVSEFDFDAWGGLINLLLFFAENLLENTDGVGAPPPPVFSRGGSLLPSSNVDARALVVTSSHSEGNDMFSFNEMRAELDRLRLEAQPGGVDAGGGSVGADDAGVTGSLCTLPAIVVKNPPGITITAEMGNILKSVLAPTSPQQIGFCGMGGIGKTTVSAWVVRNTSVRKKYDTVAWVRTRNA